MANLLTKEMLLSWGVEVKGTDVYENGKKRKPIKITTYHPYGKNKTYLAVNLQRNNKILHRVIYAWYKGEVPADMEVDHIDNDPFNNEIDNLQLVTKKENIARKVTFNNQWTTENHKLRKGAKESKGEIRWLI